jgi:hypothetical protein
MIFPIQKDKKCPKAPKSKSSQNISTRIFLENIFSDGKENQDFVILKSKERELPNLSFHF